MWRWSSNPTNYDLNECNITLNNGRVVFRIRSEREREKWLRKRRVWEVTEGNGNAIE